ncbi:hypothetical protein [Lapillicoccus jejuensis]|uniref:Uncharacterized protein n=1 Tax=Lapillicoccus jejuensis TaxID=402171 RepID=A0A542DZX0_9MICO|nr:hypothetical protein [Lapillicoccus jejuensis]TQJ08657.1 hypothetical protein FB458_1748 [Lapillicoccus jejuensis]
MSATRHDPLPDPGDLAVVELLRDAGRGAPASVDVDALLHRSRRSARRHRLGAVAGGAGAAALLVVAVVGLGSGWARPDAAPAPLPASATSTTSTTPSPSATTGATGTGTATGTATGGASSTARPGSLQAILGAGWAPDAAGDLTLDPASAAADGLPAAFTAKATRSSVPARLTDLCRGFTEKGATFTPCEARTAPDGTAVSRMVMDARLSPPGSYASLRYLRDAGGGQVEYAQVSVTAEGATADQATYAAATAWLGRYEQQLAAAAAVDVPPGA